MRCAFSSAAQSRIFSKLFAPSPSPPLEFAALTQPSGNQASSIFRFFSQASQPTGSVPSPTPAFAEGAPDSHDPQKSLPSQLDILHDDAPEASSVYGDAHAGADATASPSASGTTPSALDLLRQQIPAHVLHDLRPPARPYQLTPKLAQRRTLTPALYTPWTPTRALQRRAHVSRRMAFLMDVLEREQVQRVEAARPLPVFRAGDVLEVRVMVPEAERKVLLYRGVCIARYDKGIRSTFKIFNVYPDCGGVVHHFPLYMPDLLGVKVVGRIPASQERLYYLLEREGADYTFQQNPVTVK